MLRVIDEEDTDVRQGSSCSCLRQLPGSGGLPDREPGDGGSRPSSFGLRVALSSLRAFACFSRSRTSARSFRLPPQPTREPTIIPATTELRINRKRGKGRVPHPKKYRREISWRFNVQNVAPTMTRMMATMTFPNAQPELKFWPRQLKSLCRPRR